MPKAMHSALVRAADKKGLTGERKDAYVYGTLAKYEKRKKRRSRLAGYK